MTQYIVDEKDDVLKVTSDPGVMNRQIVFTSNANPLTRFISFLTMSEIAFVFRKENIVTEYGKTSYTNEQWIITILDNNTSFQSILNLASDGRVNITDGQGGNNPAEDVLDKSIKNALDVLRKVAKLEIRIDPSDPDRFDLI